jgi:RNA polymerase sigma-70 factor, ECF subfamily
MGRAQAISACAAADPTTRDRDALARAPREAPTVTTPMASLERRRLAPVDSAGARQPPIEFDPVTNGEAPEVVDLAHRAHRGEKGAQDAILTCLELPLRTTLHRLLGSEDDLEDLLQDVWVQVFRSLPSYRGQAQLLAWAERIAVRTTFRSLRARLRRKDVPISDLSRCDGRGLVPHSSVTDGGDPEPNADAREALRRLHAILDNLKPRYRVAFILFEFDGKSLREVAATTDASLPATKSRIIRARRRIARAARADKLLQEYVATSRSRNGASGTPT